MPRRPLHRPGFKCGFLICLCVLAAISLAIRLPRMRASEEARAARRARMLQGLDRPKSSYVPGEVLVRFRAQTSEQEKLNVHALVGTRVERRFDSVPHLEKAALPEGMSVPEAIAKYRGQPSVLYAEPNYIVHALQSQTIPNDPQFPQQWNLHNTGQNGGTAGADIHAPQAWNLTKGSSNVVVAVIDTGVDYTHPDLSSQIWSAPVPYTVTRTQGDVFTCPAGAHGFNAVAGSCDPMDDFGHGTHVSGIMGAATNNSVGIAGINWNIQILACKFLDSQGQGDLGGAITCLDMVKSLKDSGINIVASNNSWGGGPFAQSLYDAIAAQQQSGILFIAAAGNDFLDNDLAPGYPADYSLPNVISVAASTNQDEFATFSNLGRRTTHLTAPGDHILSTTPNNTYSVLSGTSMATPHVTGVAALLAAQNSSRDWRTIKNLLLSGGDSVAALASTISGKRLSAIGSLSCANQILQSRTLPVADTFTATAGNPVTVAAMSINCAQPSGPVRVAVTPGGQTVTLADDGIAPDQAAGDGIFTAQWTPSSAGSYVLTFPWGDAVQVEVLEAYSYQAAASTYTTITGTNLNLSDDSVAQISSPFPVAYGGGSFTNLYISSNGTISFTDAYDDYVNAQLPPPQLPPLTIPQPTTLLAPWWQDLFPVKGTAQNVYWGVVGSAPNRQLVVEWRDVRTFLCNSDLSATVRFQVVFLEGKSDVQFNYADTVFGGNCSAQDHGGIATVGLQESLTSAQMYSYHGEDLTDGLSLLWTIPSSAPTPSPLPVLTSISPSSTPRGGSSLTLTANGSGFVPTSRIQVSGQDRATTFVNSTTLTTQLSAGDLNSLVTPTVDVLTPAPGGGTSAQLQLTLLNPTPAITALSPSTVAAGGLTFELTVHGSEFEWGGSAIYWNGQPLQFSNVIDGNTMEAQVGFNLISAAGTAQITVQSDGPGGGTSNALPLTISPPVPGSGFSAAAQNPAQIAARAVHLDADSNGHVVGPPGQTLGKPMKFLGWNYGRKMGPAYMRYFARAHGGTAIPVQNPSLSSEPSSLAKASRSLLTPMQGTGGFGAPPGFDLRPTLPADYIPTSVATGDFNHDGKLDWVVSNGGSNTLWLYLGKGDGTSQLPTIIPLTGQSPIQVIAADLRKTGVLDLIVAEADTASVGILLGNGDGTFQPEMTLYAPGPVVSVAAADFNNDGKIDIVAGLFGDAVSGPLAFYAGDGTGHFAPPVTRPPENDIGGYYTNTIQAIDVNRDGLPDLVVSDYGSNPGAHVYLNEGNGTFKDTGAIFENGPFVTVLNAAAGDMDGDGCPDVVTSTDSGGVYIFHGNCDGTFRGFPNVFFFGAGDAGAGLALADVNGDGHLDVITSGIMFDVSVYGPPTGDAVAVLLGDGQGKLAPGRIYRGEPGMYNLAIGDVNGDGKLDVVTANQDSDSVSVYLNDGKGGFGDPTGGYVGMATDGVTGGSINDPYTGPLVADVNGDGHPDIVFIEYPDSAPNPYSWKLAVLLNDGTGHFSAPLRSDAMEGTLSIEDLQLQDVRGTGKPDLVVLGSSMDAGVNPYLGFAPNHGDGTFGPLKLVKLPGYPWLFAAGDFDGDGKLDLILVSMTGQTTGAVNRLTFLEGNGDGTFTPGASIDFGAVGISGGQPDSTFVADFNGDHKLDIIVGMNDGIITPGSGPFPVFEFFGNGDGTFQQPVEILLNATNLTMADVNHDGHPDFIELIQPITYAGFSSPTYQVHLGQPDGSFTDGPTYSPFAGHVPGSVSTGPSPLRNPGPVLADFNGDGNLDIFVPQRYTIWDAATGGPIFGRGYFQLLLGNGDGTFTPDYTVFDLAKIFPPNVAADVNGDGRADLIELDPYPSSYNVILATAGSSLQVQLVSDPVVGGHGVLRINLGITASSATTVALSASDSQINIAPSVTVPAGAVTQDVPFTIGAAFNPLHVFALRAQVGTVVAVAYGTVAQPGISSGFQVSVGNPTQSTGPGGTTPDYGVGLLSVNGYTTSVQLQCQGLPAGATCQFGMNPAPLLPSTFASVSLTVSVALGTPRGSYPFTILASDGSVSSQISATLGISDFSLSVSPAMQIGYPGQGASYTLTITPLNGWGQSVQIACPVTPPGPKCSLDGASLSPGVTTLTIDPKSAPIGNYSFTVTGSSSGVTHSASGQFNIEDATLALSATSATVNVGSSTNLSVTLNSSNGLSDQFTFSCLKLPAGVTCSFNPPEGSLPANGSLSTVLTIKVNSRPASGMIFYLGGQIPFLYARWALAINSLLIFLVCLVLLMKLPRARRRFALNRLAWGYAVLLALALASCGGGGSSGGSPPPPPTNTVVNFQVQATSPSVTRTSGTITITIP